MNVSCFNCEHGRWVNDSKMCESCSFYNNWERRRDHDAEEESGRDEVSKSDQSD